MQLWKLSMFQTIKKIWYCIILLPKLKFARQQSILEKQIELIKKIDDVTYVKDFVDETPLKKPPFSKIKAAFYTVIILCILTLLGINIDPILILLKPFIGV